MMGVESLKLAIEFLIVVILALVLIRIYLSIK